jgi:succinate dehydrogenase / fumarate reductase, cytochrome b subunit
MSATQTGTGEGQVSDRGAAGKPSTEDDGRPAPTRGGPFVVQLYRSAVGKKYVMAITGIVWMGYVFAHMVGNLKVYLPVDADGTYPIDHYGHWLRESLGYPILPEGWTLWVLRLGLIVALILHIHAAYALTVMNRKARPVAYEARREWIAADFASRTMRWTGIIILLFLGYHLADFTWGWVNPGFEHGEVHRNFVASFSNPAVSGFYILANLALGLHLYHGGWSLFQSLGINNRRFNPWRRTFAIAFAAIVVVPNISFPISVLTGIVS